MKRLMIFLLSGVLVGIAQAGDDGVAMSYAGKNADSVVTEAVVSMQDWAKGEYDEHKGEGLFEKYPAEGQLILDMMALSKELQGKAEQAKKANDMPKARAYYFSAEATAHYAARMPHMLEDRLDKD